MAKIRINFDVNSDTDSDVIQIANLLKANRSLSPMLCDLLRAGYALRFENDPIPLIESELLRDNRVVTKRFTSNRTVTDRNGNTVNKRRLHVRTQKSQELSVMEDIETGLRLVAAIEGRDTDLILEMFPQLAGMLISQMTINVDGTQSASFEDYSGGVEEIEASPQDIADNFLSNFGI